MKDGNRPIYHTQSAANDSKQVVIAASTPDLLRHASPRPFVSVCSHVSCGSNRTMKAIRETISGVRKHRKRAVTLLLLIQTTNRVGYTRMVHAQHFSQVVGIFHWSSSSETLGMPPGHVKYIVKTLCFSQSDWSDPNFKTRIES